MRIRIQKTKFRLYLGAFCFLLSGHLYLIFGQMAERIFLLASIPFFYKEYAMIFQLKKGQWYEKIHSIFIGCFFVDVVLYFTVTPVIYALGMFYIWVIAFKVFPHIAKVYDDKFYVWIFKVNIGISLLAILVSFLSEPLQLRNYSGFFENPNTFGNYTSFSTVFLFPILLEYLKHKKIQSVKKYISIIILMLLCFCVVISSSRTAFLTVILEFAFFILYVLKISLDKKNKSVLKKIFFGFLGTIFFMILAVLFIDIPEILNNAIFNKFSHLSNNQLNGRSEYWEYIWMDSKWFEDGFKDIGAAHNVYFGLIDQFGKLAGIIYLIFILLNFLKVFKFSIRHNSGFWQYCSVFAGIAFIAVSMTENYLLTNSMLWFYIMIPIQESVGLKEDFIYGKR